MSEYINHRKFLHDISNEVAIIEGGVKRAKKLLPESKESSELDEVLQMSVEHAKDCINKLKEYRSYIGELERKK